MNFESRTNAFLRTGTERALGKFRSKEHYFQLRDWERLQVRSYEKGTK